MSAALSRLLEREHFPALSDDLPSAEAATTILTPRECEIAILVAKGFSNKEVGQFLEISHWTVAAHLKSCFLKLGLRRRSELAYALRDLI
jgi:DNA-binding NarL/FixJ family response regulator